MCGAGRLVEGTMPKLAIVGASDFQNPLILKAKDMGCETYAFAWECGDIGERTANHFFPISTAEKDKILEVCRSEKIDGIVTIGSDFNNITASYVANKMGLVANSDECVARSTNKHLMRETFLEHGDPSPLSVLVREGEPLPEDLERVTFPAIVKPTDRSGSRGITKVERREDLQPALQASFDVSWEKCALVEEFLEGEEFSVEFCSWKGEHHFLQMTRKFTTGAPHFIETGHIEPPLVPAEVLERTQEVVRHALDSLGVKYGASHSEVKVDARGNVRIVEIGSRMGGDCIGSDLVELSSGIDFVGAVVDAALGREPDLRPRHEPRAAGIRFAFGQEDADVFERLQAEHPEYLVRATEIGPFDSEITDSSNRDGYFIMCAPKADDILPYLTYAQ